MTKYVIRLAAGVFVLAGATGAVAQSVNKHDLSQPTAGEIAMATECRDTYTRMRALEVLLDENRDEIAAMDIRVKKSAKTLDELQNLFEKKSAKSQTSDEAYKAALAAKREYEAAAVEHNKLIDEQDAVAKKRTVMTDEFFIVNPNYVTKCSGTIFKALSVILTCKDEQSEWCDRLK